jgi:hypothetical protein
MLDILQSRRTMSGCLIGWYCVGDLEGQTFIVEVQEWYYVKGRTFGDAKKNGNTFRVCSNPSILGMHCTSHFKPQSKILLPVLFVPMRYSEGVLL